MYGDEPGEDMSDKDSPDSAGSQRSSDTSNHSPLQKHNPVDLTTATPYQIEAEYSDSRNAKQWQSVAKQFGSIGKSVSKKLKRNLSYLADIGQN